MSAVRLTRTQMIVVMIRKLNITTFLSLTVAIDDCHVEDVIFADSDLAVMKEKVS